MAGAMPAGESAGWEHGCADNLLGAVSGSKRSRCADHQRKMALDTMSGSVADCPQYPPWVALQISRICAWTHLTSSAVTDCPTARCERRGDESANNPPCARVECCFTMSIVCISLSSRNPALFRRHSLIRLVILQPVAWSLKTDNTSKSCCFAPNLIRSSSSFSILLQAHLCFMASLYQKKNAIFQVIFATSYMILMGRGCRLFESPSCSSKMNS